MKLFGWTITRTADLQEKQLSTVSGNRGGWLPIIREAFPGAFQTNVEVRRDLVLSYFAVFACMTLIASDISKLRLRLVRKDDDGIWEEFENPAYSPVLRKPNPIQTRIQFWENWMLSKLANGNVYVLKERDQRGVVTRLYILDPVRVQVLVSLDGRVFYQLSQDDISGIETGITVPASEIIHDRMNCLFHPLIGISPLTAAGLAAMQGVNIQGDSTNFFKNASTPSGILSAPGAISNETAQRLADTWQERYSGANAGKIAVLGDNLQFVPMRTASRDSQMVEQLRWTAEVICSTFHVPPYKIGVGPMPSYNNIQSLNVEYYSQALQSLLEAAELVMDEGLELAPRIGTEFDLDGLLRMDTQTMVNSTKEAVGAGIMSPNEARARFDLPPVNGGQTPWLQQQNWPIDQLAERTVPTQANPNPAPDEDTEPDEVDPEELDGTRFLEGIEKGLAA